MMKRKILGYLRCCAGCGSSFGCIDWLCLDCEWHLLQRLSCEVRQVDPRIIHYFLFAWDPGDYFLSRLVHSLKGPQLVYVYSKLVALMCARFPKHSTDIIFYPSKGVSDHASLLASSVRGARAIKLCPLLRIGGRKQALLNLQKRSQLEFVGNPWRGRGALLVDDIVTSGATVRACYGAIDRPPELTVWSLFCRKRLWLEGTFGMVHKCVYSGFYL